MGKFVAAVLGTADVQWKLIFAQSGQSYRAPTLVMFSGATRAGACGDAQAAMGPFYCPADQQDLSRHVVLPRLERRFRGCTPARPASSRRPT